MMGFRIMRFSMFCYRLFGFAIFLGDPKNDFLIPSVLGARRP